MKQYKKILVAVELNAKTDAKPIKQAEQLAKELGAAIILVNAVENFGRYNANTISIGFEIDKVLMENATASIKTLGAKLGIPKNRLVVRLGSAKQVILEEADKLKVDLIIVGSHGVGGIRAVLGATADGVLHGAKCDVLAVRLKK